jgi:hypothetical protein
VIGFPRYSTDDLVLSIRDATEAFRLPWRAKLGLETHPQHRPYAWQSIKAMTRRYAEGFDDGYPLRPASNLLSALSAAICSWNHQPPGSENSPLTRRDILDHTKATASNGLAALSTRRLREQPQPQWQTACGYQDHRHRAIDAVRHDVEAAQRDAVETAVFASEAQAHSSIEPAVISFVAVWALTRANAR